MGAVLVGLAAAVGADRPAALASTAPVRSAASARHAGGHARTVFRDSFESENFSAWNQLRVGGDAKALVQSAFVKSGSLAAELSESRHRGSRASVGEAFHGAYGDLLVTGAFQMRNQRAGSVPLMQLLDARGRPLAAVHRSRQWLGIAYGRRSTSTRERLSLRRWTEVSLSLVLGRRSSSVEVRVGRRLVFRTRHARLSSRGVSILQIGNRAPGRSFTLVADAITVQSRAAARRSLPINTSPPSISGTFQAGRRLTASAGTWAGTRASRYVYRWRRCNRRGSGCRTIPGARGQSYALTGADVGHTLRVAVTAANSVGAATSSSSASAVVGPASAPPVATAPPVISGTAQTGQALGAQPGAWSGSAPLTFRYRWLQCDAGGAGCNAIGGATSFVYAVRTADIGNTLRVMVTAANAVGSASSISAPTAVISAGPSDSGLAALWHMDETTGSTMHDVIGHHNGTAYHVQTGRPGLAGNAFGFNGSSSYVSVPSAAGLEPGSAPVTVTIHLQTSGTPPAPPADWDIIRKGLYTSSGAEYKMEFQQSGQASCGFKGSAGYSELIAGPKINDGQWHTVQCVKTSAAIEVVVDGTSYAQTAGIGSISNSAPVVLGARPGSDWYRGTLDEASIQIG